MGPDAIGLAGEFIEASGWFDPSSEILMSLPARFNLATKAPWDV
jgi:hypothetical protein